MHVCVHVFYTMHHLNAHLHTRLLQPVSHNASSCFSFNRTLLFLYLFYLFIYVFFLLILVY